MKKLKESPFPQREIVFEPRISRKVVTDRAQKRLKELRERETTSFLKCKTKGPDIIEGLKEKSQLQDALFVLTRKIEETRRKRRRKKEQEPRSETEEQIRRHYETSAQRSAPTFTAEAYLDSASASYHPMSMVSNYADRVSDYRSALPHRSRTGF